MKILRIKELSCKTRIQRVSYRDFKNSATIPSSEASPTFDHANANLNHSHYSFL